MYLKTFVLENVHPILPWVMQPDSVVLTFKVGRVIPYVKLKWYTFVNALVYFNIVLNCACANFFYITDISLVNSHGQSVAFSAVRQYCLLAVHIFLDNCTVFDRIEPNIHPSCLMRYAISKENALNGEQMVLALRLYCWRGSADVQNNFFPHIYHLLPANLLSCVSIQHSISCQHCDITSSLPSLARQVHLNSLYSLLLVNIFMYFHHPGFCK